MLSEVTYSSYNSYITTRVADNVPNIADIADGFDLQIANEDQQAFAFKCEREDDLDDEKPAEQQPTESDDELLAYLNDEESEDEESEDEESEDEESDEDEEDDQTAGEIDAARAEEVLQAVDLKFISITDYAKFTSALDDAPAIGAYDAIKHLLKEIKPSVVKPEGPNRIKTENVLQSNVVQPNSSKPNGTKRFKVENVLQSDALQSDTLQSAALQSKSPKANVLKLNRLKTENGSEAKSLRSNDLKPNDWKFDPLKPNLLKLNILNSNDPESDLRKSSVTKTESRPKPNNMKTESSPKPNSMKIENSSESNHLKEESEDEDEIEFLGIVRRSNDPAAERSLKQKTPSDLKAKRPPNDPAVEPNTKQTPAPDLEDKPNDPADVQKPTSKTPLDAPAYPPCFPASFFYCTICKVCTNSLRNLTQHLVGNKHATRLQEVHGDPSAAKSTPKALVQVVPGHLWAAHQSNEKKPPRIRTKKKPQSPSEQPKWQLHQPYQQPQRQLEEQPQWQSMQQPKWPPEQQLLQRPSYMPKRKKVGFGYLERQADGSVHCHLCECKMVGSAFCIDLHVRGKRHHQAFLRITRAL